MFQIGVKRIKMIKNLKCEKEGENCNFPFKCPYSKFDETFYKFSMQTHKYWMYVRNLWKEKKIHWQKSLN